MFALKDIIALMDRWDEWRATKEAAQRVPELEQRITELEQKLSPDAWPPDVCKHCGKRELRLGFSRPADKGVPAAQRWDCHACKRSEWR